VWQTCQGFQLQTTFHEALVKAADNNQTCLATLKAILKGDSKVNRNFSIEKDLLLYKKRWYIPKDEGLRRTIIEAEHVSKIAGHFGMYKTIGWGRANFYWPKMDEHITEYIRSCDICQRNKVIRHKEYGLLEPLEVPMRPWTAISMDFIVGLPKSDGYTKIWVIVHRFSKMAHFILLKTKEHIKELALTFVKEIWSLHGQTERVNQTLEQYLRSYCTCQQDNWVSLLPFAEHAYHTSTSESTNASPFEINYGFSPQTQWSGMVSDKQGIHPDSELMVKDWEGTWQEI